MDYKKLTVSELCLLHGTLEKIITPYANFQTSDGTFSKEYMEIGYEIGKIKDELLRRIKDGK